MLFNIMKKLKLDYVILKYKLLVLLVIFLFSKSLYSNEIKFEIQGNEFSDTNAILSILKEIPENIDKEYSNDIIRKLSNSNLFSDVKVELKDNKYLITVKEYPNIDRIYFENNERLKDDDLEIIASQIEFTKFNSLSTNIFINELKNIYQSYGYNDVTIEYSEKKYENNTVDLFFKINEGKITKINKIIIKSNNLIKNQEIRSILKSKTKTIINIFANNNYKPSLVESDKNRISNYYRNNGYVDVNVSSKIEYLKSNKVNIYFLIDEGSLYSFSSVKIKDENNIINKSTKDKINNQIDIFLNTENIFSEEKTLELEKLLSSMIIEDDLNFFEINTFQKKEDKKIDILFQILPILPKYTKQINIVGNSRTMDHVIRRELEIIEGDPIYSTQIESIRNKLLSLDLFESVNVSEELIDDNNVNLIIDVEEKQTGTFNAGVSVGTLDGFAIVTGLKERNFYGTGRSLDALLNTSEGRNQFKLVTTDRLSYENDADISYSINYVQQDFSKSSSYKLDKFTSGIGISYKINKNLFHSIDFEYVLKDYKITDSSTVANAILKSSGSNISYLIQNNFMYSTLNRGFIAKKGNSFSYNNTIETPTSSNNGYIRNIVNIRKYISTKKTILGTQLRFGNIFSLNDSDIITDDKFSLGGRLLRGFDNYGAGPRNSRTSYVGGNNIASFKLDYSYEISNQSDFPFYLNIFNDYGLIWDNKTKPTQNDNNLRSSVGFGIRYYSPIGPIGLTWGFPVMDEEYDIKRMFLFSIGNLD